LWEPGLPDLCHISESQSQSCFHYYAHVTEYRWWFFTSLCTNTMLC